MSSPTFNALRFRALGPASASGPRNQHRGRPTQSGALLYRRRFGWRVADQQQRDQLDPVFDNEGSYSIGTVALDPKNPSTVWVGTGENNSQRSVSWGDGIYRSDDNGRTWRNLGSEDSSTSPNRDRSAGFERGIGCVARAVVGCGRRARHFQNHRRRQDLEERPENQREHRRDGYRAGSDESRYADRGQLPAASPPVDADRRRAESAIYKSDDAGEHWRRIRSGLPQGDIGRIGLTYSPAQRSCSTPRSKAANNQSAIYRSADGGESWERRAAFEGIPMYYGQIVADPKDPEKFYFGDTNMRVSDDGGRTLRALGDRNKHVDSHTIWIDPQHTDHLLVGCDGGLYESYDGGQFWEYKPNLPTLQFYDVEVDNSKPYYYVYGGTQDNASLGGPHAIAAPTAFRIRIGS
jgi:photosystem II stability/assembly factor-like uncharacterized protein